jgi:hypothetical protein
MKNIFISFGGDFSMELARHLEKWLRDVVPGADPFYSNHDIQPGDNWFSELSETLNSVPIIICCFTPENLANNWIFGETCIFLSRPKSKHVVCSVLFGGVDRGKLLDLYKPWQVIDFSKDEMLRLAKVVNELIHPNDNSCDSEFSSNFEKQWSDFQSTILSYTTRKLEDMYSTSLSKVDRCETMFKTMDAKITKMTLAFEQQCQLRRSNFFSDIERVMRLLHSVDPASRPEEIPNFREAASKTRQKSISSIYVLPLFQKTFEYFSRDVEHKKWLDEETTLLKEKPALKHSFRRVVILDSELNQKRTQEFLKPYRDSNWRIIYKADLQQNESSLFRNFCIFNMPSEQGANQVAYFTYLDRDHIYSFTKGPWVQYRTENTDYIRHLEHDFDQLWKHKNRRDIQEWLKSPQWK